LVRSNSDGKEEGEKQKNKEGACMNCGRKDKTGWQEGRKDEGANV
jgi:hypothetical protein